MRWSSQSGKMATIGDYIFLAIVVALIYAIHQGVTRGSPAVQEELKRRQEELKVRRYLRFADD